MMNNNDIKIKIDPQTQQDNISIVVNPQAQQDILIKTDLPVLTKSYKQLKDLPQINGITLEDNKTSEELGLQSAGDYALKSEIPIIPTDISAFNNDVGYLTEHQDISNLATKEELSNKQDKLIAGSGIDITNNIISNTQTSAEWGNIQGDLSNQTDLQTVLDNKQDVITDLATIREGASKGATALQTEIDPIYTADKPNLALKTEIPTKTSELTNDSNFITSSYHDSTKQDKLTAGNNITIVNNVISATGGGGSGTSYTNTVLSPISVFKNDSTNAQAESVHIFNLNTLFCASVVEKVAWGGGNNFSEKNIYLGFYKDTSNYISMEMVQYNIQFIIVSNGEVLKQEIYGTGYSSEVHAKLMRAKDILTGIDLITKTYYIYTNTNSGDFEKIIEGNFTDIDISFIDNFKVVTSAGARYRGLTANKWISINNKHYDRVICDTLLEYGMYNILPTKPVYDDFVGGRATGIKLGGTITETIDNLHKISNVSMSSETYLACGITNSSVKGNYLCSCFRVKLTNMSDGTTFSKSAPMQRMVMINEVTGDIEYEYDLQDGNIRGTSTIFTPQEGVWYTCYIESVRHNQDYIADYGVYAKGKFTLEIDGNMGWIARNAYTQICAANYNGEYFTGVLPFKGSNIKFVQIQNTSQADKYTSYNGIGIPLYATTITDGNIYMYNGTTWKQISS